MAELYPDAGIWPQNKDARAIARAVSAEMHGGFGALRTHMAMDLQTQRHEEGPEKMKQPGVTENIKRITDIWEDCRDRFGADGDFLFGTFGAADFMFAPVVTRFQTYGVPLPPVCQAYAEAVRETPEMREWTDGALAEPAFSET